jgi:hypothetical protein
VGVFVSASWKCIKGSVVVDSWKCLKGFVVVDSWKSLKGSVIVGCWNSLKGSVIVLGVKTELVVGVEVVGGVGDVALISAMLL